MNDATEHMVLTRLLQEIDRREDAEENANSVLELEEENAQIRAAYEGWKKQADKRADTDAQTIQAQTAAIESLREENDQMRSQLAQKPTGNSKQVEELENQIKFLQLRYESLREKYNALIDAREEDESTLEKQAQRIVDLEKRNDNLSSEIQDLLSQQPEDVKRFVATAVYEWENNPDKAYQALSRAHHALGGAA